MSAGAAEQPLDEVQGRAAARRSGEHLPDQLPAPVSVVDSVKIRPIGAGTVRLPSGQFPFISVSDGIDRRRSSPIHAYVGPNGGGKSACMIRDTLPSLAAGRPVLSTVKILDHLTGEPHPLYIPFVHWDQVRDFRGGDLLLDEVVGIANSRSSGMPDDIQNILAQLRRRDVLMRWTAPAYQRADLVIRETSQAITLLHGYAKDRKIVRQRGDAVGAVRAWAPNRLFSAITYDAGDMSQFNAASARGEQSKLKPKFVEWFWGPSSPVFDAYNTMDAVNQVSSLCPIDGGRRMSKTCKGNHTPEELHAAEYASLGNLGALGALSLP